jgi:GGDEF domain-containing protein
VETVTARLEGNLCTENKQNNSYQLSLSVGTVWIAHDSNLSIDQLVDQADKAMYDHKRGKKQLGNSIVQVGFEPIKYRRLKVV